MDKLSDFTPKRVREEHEKGKKECLACGGYNVNNVMHCSVTQKDLADRILRAAARRYAEIQKERTETIDWNKHFDDHTEEELEELHDRLASIDAQIRTIGERVGRAAMALYPEEGKDEQSA